ARPLRAWPAPAAWLGPARPRHGPARRARVPARGRRSGGRSWRQEVRVGVRPVDGRVAARAVAERGLHVVARRGGVAFEAELRDLLAREQMPVHAAVRLVGARAAFGQEARVLEHERPLHLGVTRGAQAILVVAEGGMIAAAVRLVAIEAAHRALGHLVVLGQGERQLDVLMAAVAERWWRRRE